MSDRGRPHNIGQALFEGLGSGLEVYGNFLQQERARKSQTTQQSFLNRLRLEAAGRDQVGLDQGQARLDLQIQKHEDSLIGQTTDNPDLISDLDQSLINQRNAAAALSRGRLGNLGQGGASKPLTAKQKADLLQDLFQQSVSGGQERFLGETVGRLGELGAFQQEAQVPGIGGDSGAFSQMMSQANVTKPPTNILGLRAFLAQNPELAQDSAVGDISQRLFGLGSPSHQRAFTATPDSAFAINPFVAEQIFPDVDLDSLRIDDTGSEVDSIVDDILRQLLGE